jgi:hypothetical protein
MRWHQQGAHLSVVASEPHPAAVLGIGTRKEVPLLDPHACAHASGQRGRAGRGGWRTGHLLHGGEFAIGHAASIADANLTD